MKRSHVYKILPLIVLLIVSGCDQRVPLPSSTTTPQLATMTVTTEPSSTPPPTLTLTPTTIPVPTLSVEELPEYNVLFERDSDWIGADAAYSIPLSDDRTLWLFGDTIIGDIHDGKRVNTKPFARNSIAIQQGKDPTSASIEFFWGAPQNSNPTPFIVPDDGQGWFWFSHGILTSGGLYLFLMQMDTDTAAGPGIFSFKHIGLTLAHVANPNDDPTEWRITQHKIPWARIAPHNNLLFGAALLQAEDFIYIYGFDEQPKDNGHESFMILARAPKDKLADFNQWQFYANGQWLSDWQQVTPLFPIGTEYSVSYQKMLEQYVVVYWDTACCFSKKALLRHASTPYGPWSEPLTLYTCPEMDWHPQNYCYAAKGHPELSYTADELIITYVANSLDFGQLFSDARLYWPRFLRIKFASP